MYFNFNNALVCRNCCYMPCCPKCERYYISEDIFKGEKGTERLMRPDGNKNIKQELKYIVHQIAGIINHEGSKWHCSDKEEMRDNINKFLKSFNDHYELGIDRYTEDEKDYDRLIETREDKIKDYKKRLNYHIEWHEEHIKELEEEISVIKKKKAEKE